LQTRSEPAACSSPERSSHPTAYVWMVLAQGAALIRGVIAPQALLGISFAMLVALLTASVMSSVKTSDEGLASGITIRQAASRSSPVWHWPPASGR
jgi:hypothetical protein